MRHFVIVVVCVTMGACLLGARLISLVYVNWGYLDLSHAVIDGAPLGGVFYDPPPANKSPLLEEAGRRFTQARNWWTENGQAYGGSGQVLMWQGDYTRAALSLNEAVRLGGITRYGYLMGNAQMFSGNRKQALDFWMLAGDNLSTRLALSTRIFGQSNWDNYHPDRWNDAIYVLQSTLTRSNLALSEVVALNLRLADMYQHIGNLGEAEGAVRAAIAIQPDDSLSWSTLAWVLMDANRQDAALQAAQTSLDRGPGWRAHYVRGHIFLQRCELVGAMQEFVAGLANSVDNYRFYYQIDELGDVYWEQGRDQEALAQWGKFIQFQPGITRVAQKITEAKNGELGKRCDTH